MTMKQFYQLMGVLMGLGLWLAIVMIAQQASAADFAQTKGDRAPVISPDRTNKSFIDRSTAIQVCVEDIQEIQATGEVPELFAQYKRYLRGVKIQLQKEGFKNWRDLMWGAAIKICMQDEGYVNTCVSKRGRDGDLQLIETAKVPTCWDPADRAEAPTAPPKSDTIPCEVWNPACNPRAQVPPPPPPGPIVPAMSPADVQQFNEDMGIISQPVRIIGDDEGGAKESRFGSCFSYWQSLSYNRSPEARHVLYAVRVARCMYRTNYAILRSRCPWDWNSMLSARCYARF